MAFVEARGLRFHVQELGREDGPTLVMLHGLFTGSLASWWFTAAPALARTHRVRLLDLRGHGLSERPAEGYHRSSMIDDVLALTDDLAPFAVVGHSYGGLLAVELGLRHPERVTAVAAVEPPLVALDGGFEASVDDGEWAATSIVRDLRSDPVLTDEQLGSLAAPAWFAFGRRSGYAGGADRVRRVLPEARCDVLDGGHALHVDARDEVTARLVDFLAEPEAVAYG